MATYVALLRGVNLGPSKKVAMADLRALVEDLGGDAVKTHLNSGNVLFKSSTSASKLENDISAAIERRLRMDVKVVVRSAGQLDAVVKNNPFVKKKFDIKQLAAVFLGAKPPAAKVGSLTPDAYKPNEYVIGDKVIYIRQPNGFAGTTLPDWHKVLGVTATARNWTVVTKLRELAHDL
jgi:uncharacterized protein (DUF1697 family)